MKFHIRTLGCKMNWLDSARVTAVLQAAGHQPVPSEGEADLIFVNSCTVTGEADRKSRKAASAASRVGVPVTVMGCAPRVDGAAWRARLPEATIVGSEQELFAALGIEADEVPFTAASRTRVPIAIQTGCDNHCTFCITRVARGRHANLPAEGIIRQIREAEAHGVSEIVLTGINLAAWGASDSNRAEEARLGELLERILNETAMPRIRLSSLGPQYLGPHFFDVFADERICDYLHISLQSGSATVLEAMDRGHGVEEMRAVAERAREVRPNVALAADIIVGFPGEGPNLFDETQELIRELRFSKLHVFPYSIREGTPAANMPAQVPASEKKARAALLRQLGRELRHRFLHEQLGTRQRVLVESGGAGWTGNYIRVALPDAAAGGIVDVTLELEQLLELQGDTER